MAEGSPSADENPILADEVREMQIRQHLDYTRRALLVSFLASLIVLTVFHAAFHPPLLLYAWITGLNLLSIVRMLVERSWRRDPLRVQHGPQWEARFALLAGIAGLLWGGLGSFLYPFITIDLQPLATMCVLGVAAGAVMSLVSLPVAYNAFYLNLLLPSAIAQGIHDSPLEHWSCFILALFTITLLASGRATAANLRQTFELRLRLATALTAAEDARARAEHANQAKSMFLANMSHELRTPMHAILGFSQLGISRAMDTKMRDYFERVSRSGARLLSLINDLLDLSKLEAGRVEMDFQNQALRPLVDAAVHEVEALLAERDLHLHIEEAPDMPRARLDSLRFSQVVRNLLSNALKFSPEGSHIAILLDSLTAPDDTQRLRLRLRDEGPGIPEAELQSIFDEFVQSSKSRTGAGGTGLGLAITRRIVLAHGGHVFARNRPSGGAEFTVEIPVTGPR